MNFEPSSKLFELFQCNSCGNCCRGDGVVELSQEEALEIFQHLNINKRTFLKKYARKDKTGYVLRDHPGPSKECIFLENNLCIVHAVKPQQCRDFPRKWHDRDMLNNCEGMKTAWMQLMAEDENKE